MLVFGAIAPHGGDILEEIADDPRVMAKTRSAMQEMGRRFRAAHPDTVVVLTPHGIVVEGAISCGATKLAGGMLGDAPKQIQAVFETDRDLVERIFAEAATHELPLARLVGEENAKDAVLPLDWGALIPLWYTAQTTEPRPQVVVLAPDRSLPRETLVRSGVAIARAADASGKRVALIASCDQGHAHDKHGPYGYSPASATHDTAMCAAIEENDLPRLLEWPEAFLEEAKVDAFWQTIILAGALGHTPMHGELLSYEAPTGGRGLRAGVKQPSPPCPLSQVWARGSLVAKRHLRSTKVWLAQSLGRSRRRYRCQTPPRPYLGVKNHGLKPVALCR